MSDTTEGVALYARTLQLARTAPRHVKQKHMAKAVGKSEVWISEFINEKARNPSVHDVQALHDFLIAVPISSVA